MICLLLNMQPQQFNCCEHLLLKQKHIFFCGVLIISLPTFSMNLFKYYTLLVYPEPEPGNLNGNSSIIFKQRREEVVSYRSYSTVT